MVYSMGVGVGYAAEETPEGSSMAQSRTVARLAGLELRVAPSAAASFLLTWGVLTVAGARWGGLSRRAAAIGGLVAATGHWDAILVHHLGHALAARGTGYPMTGVDFRGPLGVSLYPDDEPTLNAATHRHRALGGPLLSALNGVLFGYLALLLRRRGGVPYRVAQFLCFDNLGVIAAGSLIPVGPTDGGTLLRLHGQE